MKRFTGIGVAAGLAAGRAGILIQRARVLRYQITPSRVDQELARLDPSGGRLAVKLVGLPVGRNEENGTAERPANPDPGKRTADQGRERRARDPR